MTIFTFDLNTPKISMCIPSLCDLTWGLLCPKQEFLQTENQFCFTTQAARGREEVVILPKHLWPLLWPSVTPVRSTVLAAVTPAQSFLFAGCPARDTATLFRKNNTICCMNKTAVERQKNILNITCQATNRPGQDPHWRLTLWGPKPLSPQILSNPSISRGIRDTHSAAQQQAALGVSGGYSEKVAWDSHCVAESLCMTFLCNFPVTALYSN